MVQPAGQDVADPDLDIEPERLRPGPLSDFWRAGEPSALLHRHGDIGTVEIGERAAKRRVHAAVGRAELICRVGAGSGNKHQHDQGQAGQGTQDTRFRKGQSELPEVWVDVLMLVMIMIKVPVMVPKWRQRNGKGH